MLMKDCSVEAMRKSKNILVSSLVLSLFFGVAHGQGDPASIDVAPLPAMKIQTLELVEYQTATECEINEAAVGGFDLLSYREEGGLRLGREEFAAEYGGGVYLFESAARRDKFLAAPLMYLPDYGGWCAISMALGRRTCPDYSNFKIEDGKLLLFAVTAFTDGRALWNTNPPKYRKQANSNYDRFLRD